MNWLESPSPLNVTGDECTWFEKWSLAGTASQNFTGAGAVDTVFSETVVLISREPDPPKWKGGYRDTGQPSGDSCPCNFGRQLGHGMI